MPVELSAQDNRPVEAGDRSPGEHRAGYTLFSANRVVAAMFLASAKHRRKHSLWNTCAAERQTAPYGISGPHFKARISGAANYVRRCVGRMTSAGAEGPKLTLSRTAHDDVFALWVYAYGAIDSGLLSMVSRTRELPPRREDECIDC